MKSLVTALLATLSLLVCSGCSGSKPPEARARDEITKSIAAQSHGFIEIKSFIAKNTIPVGSAGTECDVVCDLELNFTQTCYWGDGMAGQWYGKFPAAAKTGDAWQRTEFAFSNSKGETQRLRDYHIRMVKSDKGWIIKSKSHSEFGE